jgi:colicin import membrane protein
MEDISKTEEQNKRKGFIFSVVFHTLLIILAALYGFTYQSPPPEPGGILVNLGIPDVGQGDENAPKNDVAPAEAPEEMPEEVPEEKTPPPPPKKTVEKPAPAPKKEVVKTEDPEAAALKKKRDEERRQQELEAKREAEAERQRIAAEAETQRKAEAARKRKEAEAQALRDKIAGGLSGSGKGKGNTGKPGNQGDPNGDPNSNVLEGISTGAGVIGGGLGGRGVLKKGPSIKDNSQEQGTVFLAVCVDSNGNVVSAEYTQKGSTTSNSRLKQLAIRNAKAWKFSKAGIDKQCGTIRYDFKLK